MATPLLHTRVRDSIEMSQAPVQVLAAIKALAGEQFCLDVDDSDPDNILFEMKRQTDDITISGLIRRWQGTESRLDYIGEVDVTLPGAIIPNIMLTILLGGASILYWLSIAPQQGRFSFFINIPTFYILAIITFLIYLGVIYRIGNMLLRSYRGDKRRWQLQQEMAKVIEGIRNIETHAA